MAKEEKRSSVLQKSLFYHILKQQEMLINIYDCPWVQLWQ